MRTMPNSAQMQHRNRATSGLVVLIFLLPWAAWSGGVVTQCTESNLRAAMSGGGTVTFACDGLITLTGTITNQVNTVLDASGHQVTISGGGAVRLFHVNSNVTFTVVNLTLTGGYSIFGSGVYNDGGTVSLLGTCLHSNLASAEPWLPSSGLYARGGNGGAIGNRGGTICATNTRFLNNVARQGLTPVAVEWGFPPPFPTEPCLGGAIDNQGGRLYLDNCAFWGNQALGGAGAIWTRNGVPLGAGAARNAEGGAIYSSGSMNAVHCVFTGNLAVGGLAPAQTAINPTYPGTGLTGASGGTAVGGAVGNAGALFIEKSLFASNGVSGGPGGAGGPGWSGSTFPPFVSDGGVGGPGGSGSGGALFNRGFASLVNCTVAWNSGSGGSGGSGGQGGTWAPSYYGAGGAGGNGGAGSGGIFSVNALTNCTVAFNSGTGGSGGPGGAPGGAGPSAGAPGTNGWASGAVNGGTLLNTLLATNAPVNSTGNVFDAGNNLSSDATPVFTDTSSLNDTEPKLGPLADNGGTTLTVALRPGSPAIDAGDDAAAPLTDQRGIPRPVGSSCDIGAYEFTAMLEISRVPPNQVNVLVYGPAGQTCRLLGSATLSDWRNVATKTFGPDGTALFEEGCCTGESLQFYKVELP